jgi:hypothetical protein
VSEEPVEKAPPAAREHEPSEPTAPPPADVGPDPVWGLTVGIVGLVVMAVGGAGNWHWTFNIGEGVMLLGAFVFFYCVAATHLKQRPIERGEAGRVAARFFAALGRGRVMEAFRALDRSDKTKGA